MFKEKHWNKFVNIALNVLSNERGYDQLMAEVLTKARKVCLNCGKKLWRFEKIVEIEFETPKHFALSDIKQLRSKVLGRRVIKNLSEFALNVALDIF